MISDDDKATLEGEARIVEGEVIRPGEAPNDAEAEPEITTGQLLTALLKPAFDILAPNWDVTTQECALLGESYGAVADKYLPNLNLGVELSAVLATLAVFGPRWNKPRKKPDPEQGDLPLDK